MGTSTVLVVGAPVNRVETTQQLKPRQGCEHSKRIRILKQLLRNVMLLILPVVHLLANTRVRSTRYVLAISSSTY
jgi:hypothetical protein